MSTQAATVGAIEKQISLPLTEAIKISFRSLKIRFWRSLITIGGIFFAALAPIIAGSVVYLRYRRTDPRPAPSARTDVLLWICFLAMVGMTGYVLYLKFTG